MAQGNSQQYSQVRCVIREAYKPDTTFRIASETKRTANLAVSQMPVECVIMEIRSILWEVPAEYLPEKQWFLAHYDGGLSWAEIAVNAGMKYGSGNHILERCNNMLDDSISKMPYWLFNRCLTIYDIFLKGGIE